MSRPVCIFTVLTAIVTGPLLAASPEVLEAERQRVEVIEQVSRATVAVFDSGGEGGGSGVLISPDGYALTNFHVTAPCGPAMRCGLNDGKLYDAVLVGLDPPGDVALIKLLGRDDFPVAQLGDSDTCDVGDDVIVAGNPFLLAEDFHPTVTWGILSGTHRYQYPAGTLLEYADCLQTDASINPGNSGGPLFSATGQLIGINGRGSFEKRGRVNVGVGYAISINQIKMFLSHLKSGRIVDHATLGATVASAGEDRVVVDDLLEGSDAYRRGMRYGDYLSSFGGRDITTANRLKNALGVYPAGWTVPLEYIRDGQVFEAAVRLTTLHGEGELESLIETESARDPQIEPPGPQDEEGEEDKPKFELPQGRLPKAEPELPPAVDQRYEKRAGFANYYFNRQHQQRIAEQCSQWDAFEAGQTLAISGIDSLGHEVSIETSMTKASFRSVRGQFFADFSSLAAAGDNPPGSGGLMVAIRQWHKLLSAGLAAFDEAYYFGQLPFGPSLTLHDAVIAVDEGYTTYFYFDLGSGNLVAMEHYTADDRDPCTVEFGRFGKWESAELPMAWAARFGGNNYLEFSIDQYSQSDPAAAPGDNDEDDPTNSEATSPADDQEAADE